MTTGAEKLEIQDEAFKILDAAGIEYIHIPNRMFSPGKTAPEKLRYFPDVGFMFQGVYYMREFGIGNNNKWRKEKQREKMERWGKHGANIGTIKSKDELILFFKEIKMIK